MTLDIHKIRADFPVLDQQVNGSSLIYFDNAATTQKPKSVIDALSHYYASDNANIHRGLHALAERATNAYELTRTKIKEFINAPSSDQIILTAGTTGSINLVAQTFGRANFSKGDKIFIKDGEKCYFIDIQSIRMFESDGNYVKVYLKIYFLNHQ